MHEDTVVGTHLRGFLKFLLISEIFLDMSPSEQIIFEKVFLHKDLIF